MGAGVEEQGRYARRAREERLRRDERTTGMSAEANDGSAGDTHARGSKRGSTDLWTETKEEGQTKERERDCKAYITEQEHGRSVPLSSLLGLPLFLHPSFLSVRSPLPARASPSARVVSSSSPNPRSPSSPASSSSIRTARTARSQSHRTSRPRCDNLSLAGERTPSLHARSSPGPSRRFTCCVAERHSEIPPCASPFLVTLRHDHAPPASMPVRGAH